MIFRFEAPWLLSLLVLVPLLATLPLWARSGGWPASLRYADVRRAAGSVRSWRLTFRPALVALRMLALALLIVAVARPQTGEARQIVRGEGVDIALALDMSGSMASLDFEPQDRLEAAKQVIGAFVTEREFDRIGLVVFASTAFSQSPPTVDHEVLVRLLGEVELATDLGIEDGTAIGLGIASAANMLKDSTAKSRVVILLTDGLNNSGEIDPLTAATAAAALDIKVYTIGVGRQGQVPFPVRSALGDRIVFQESELDEDLLREVADITNGRFFRATDTDELREIYGEISSLETSTFDVRTYRRFDELAGWLLVPALVLLVLERVLGQTVFRKIP